MHMTRRLPLHLVAVILAVTTVALLGASPGQGSPDPHGGYLELTGPGSGYLEVLDDAGLNPGSAITLEAWLYLESYDGFGQDAAGNCPIIAGKNWMTGYAISLACGGDVMSSIIEGTEYASEFHTIPLQTWTHLAWSYDGTVLRHYVNGELDIVRQPGSGPVDANSDPFRIGTDVAWDYSPHGRIDDVRIWDHARSQAQVQLSMNGVPPHLAGLVANWTFENGSTADVAGGREGVIAGDARVFPPPPGAIGARGDANCDGYVDATDATGILAMIAELSSAPPADCPAAAGVGTIQRLDANCDQLVDMLDPLAILRRVAEVDEWGETCPTPEPTATPEPSPTPD